MKPYLIAAALAFASAVGLYGFQCYTHTETLGMSRLSVLGLTFAGGFCVLLAIVAFFVSLMQKKKSTTA